MNLKKFNQLYHILTEQKEQNTFLVEFNIQEVDFLFFKQQKNYVCKFSFEFLNEQQQVTVELLTDNNIKFVIKDQEDEEQEYDKKQFKEYFYFHYNLFVEAVNKFKEFLSNNKKIEQQTNTLKIIPLEKVLNKQNNTNTNVNIEGTIFEFFKVQSSFKDVFKASFTLIQNDQIAEQKDINVIVKSLFGTNYFIIKVLVNNKAKEGQQVEESQVIEMTKDQFAQTYPVYFNKLNKAIKAYLQLD